MQTAKFTDKMVKADLIKAANTIQEEKQVLIYLVLFLFTWSVLF